MMPASGDTSLANLPEPRSLEEVAAIVLALDRAAEGRYAALSHELRGFAPPALAELLEDLAGEHRDHAERTAAGHKNRDLAPEGPASPLPQVLSEDTAAVCDLLGLTPYKVLALAVTLAQQSFQLYSYLAGASDPAVRDLAQRLAGEQLSRAASLRIERRRAYHAGRRGAAAEGYPAAPQVETQADLLAAALAIENKLEQDLARNGEEEGLSAAHRATRQRVARLRDAAGRAGEPGAQMAEELARFAHSARSKASAESDRPAAIRHLLADCERAFSFYDAVASAPADEAVMLQAQDLSQAAVERIAQVRTFAEASDEAGRVER